MQQISIFFLAKISIFFPSIFRNFLQYNYLYKHVLQTSKNLLKTFPYLLWKHRKMFLEQLHKLHDNINEKSGKTTNWRTNKMEKQQIKEATNWRTNKLEKQQIKAATNWKSNKLENQVVFNINVYKASRLRISNANINRTGLSKKFCLTFGPLFAFVAFFFIINCFCFQRGCDNYVKFVIYSSDNGANKQR